MKAYLVRRTLNLIPTLLLVSLIVFAVVRILPGDPVYTLAAVEDGNEIDKKEIFAENTENEPELSQNGSNPDDPDPKEEELSESDD